MTEYQSWVDRQRASLGGLAGERLAAAQELLFLAETTPDRMERGIRLLMDDPNALDAFRTANRAVAAALARRLTREGASGASPRWRPFQLAASRTPTPDFVWTGPEVAGLHARDTRRVYEELLGSATRSIWASTYVFSDGPRAFRTLAERMDAVPQLDVTLLLNIERRRGDTTAADSLVRRFADEFWGGEWPGAARPKVYYDPRSVEPDNPTGVLHAKAVVAEEESVFITSANLTAAAQDRNIELCLLVRDRTLTATTVIHFRTLVEKDLLRRLPDA